MKTLKIIVTGKVTGVGFRYAARRQAHRCGDLSGWVRNRDARTVEALVQGAGKEVDALVDWMRQGPPGARVEQCQVSEQPVSQGLESFHISF